MKRFNVAMAQEMSFAGALLFVPGDRPDRFVKAVATGADQVIFDLEDAVGPGNKLSARAAVSDWLDGGSDAVVRINGVDSIHHREDLEVCGSRARAIVLPKSEEAEAVAAVVAACRVPVLALVETPAGVVNAAAVAASGVTALLFGNVDFAAAIGVDPASHRALLAARSTLVYASAAAGLLPPIDGVTTALRSSRALAADLAQSRELGFAGKLCVHPDQVRPTQLAFAPTEEEVRWAEVVLSTVTAEDHDESCSGAVAVNGEMVDEPVMLRARSILQRTAQHQNHGHARGTEKL